MPHPLASYIDELVHLGGVDLHLHSTSSDGSVDPGELPHIASEANLRAFSLTDHDAVRGNLDVIEQLHTMKELGHGNLPEFIPGLELSLSYLEEEIHVLVFFPNQESFSEIRPFLKEQGETRDYRNFEMVERLQKLRIPITFEELNSKAKRKAGRLHMAQWLVEHDYAETINHAFEKYLSKNGLAYVKRKRVSLTEGLAVIKNVGGVAFLAHPQQYSWGNNYELVQEHFAQLSLMGLDGIEAFHGEATNEQAKLYYSCGKSLNLSVCAGSDWHGVNKENRPYYTGDKQFIFK